MKLRGWWRLILSVASRLRPASPPRTSGRMADLEGIPESVPDEVFEELLRQ